MTALTPVEVTTPRLAEGLRGRLPGLSAALDEDRATKQVRRLLAPGTVIAGLSAGKAWLRDDGTCTVRYDVRLAADADGRARRQTVLGHVHRGDDPAARYVVTRVLPIIRASPHAVMPPWRRRAVVAPGTGLALHPFPLDPGLPTLGSAMDLASVQPMLPEAPLVTVEVVHHPREGACVLCYAGAAADGRSTSLYGKVYGDAAAGRTACRRLHALRDADLRVCQAHVRLPVPLAYDPTLRLLVTEALPGSPLLPSMLTDLRTPPRADSAPVRSLLEAVRRCGRALASLHRGPRIGAPQHGPTQEMASLRRELRVVAGVWPERAHRVRRCLPLRLGDLLAPAGPVLCHGDFTPSQVLLGDGPCGVTDLDDLCVAEPAVDIGRFLACLAMLVARAPGADTGTLLRALTTAFLDGYESLPSGATPRPDVRRAAFYRRCSLARSALHACRQLKDGRFARAVTLLERDPGGWG